MALGEFSYRATKDGRVRIAFRGRPVVTLTGARAERFRAQATGAGEGALQLLMARFTGNERSSDRP